MSKTANELQSIVRAEAPTDLQSAHPIKHLFVGAFLVYKYLTTTECLRNTSQQNRQASV